ncbi:nucleoporin SEH1-like [Argonauta hians]
MSAPKSIQTDHEDLIHDVAYDFYGERLATCSSDQSVKIWDKTEDGLWHQSASWKAHTGSVWRVAWAHPDFGQVIATCSFDRAAGIWEELPSESRDDSSKTKWVKRPNLVDSRSSVTDVKFAPKHLGLQLATCTSDGMVRIYQAPDVMNLSHWSLDYEINCKLSCSCLSWNPSRLCSPMLAVGSDDASPTASGKVSVYQYNDQQRLWNKLQTLSVPTDPVHDLAFSPNFGRSYHLLAVASKDLYIFQMTPIRQEGHSDYNTSYEICLIGQFDDHEHQVWRLSWNVTGTILASSGYDGKVRLWKANYLRNWKCISVLVGDIPQAVCEFGQSKSDLSPIGTSSLTAGPGSNKRYSRGVPLGNSGGATT